MINRLTKKIKKDPSGIKENYRKEPIRTKNINYLLVLGQK